MCRLKRPASVTRVTREERTEVGVLRDSCVGSKARRGERCIQRDRTMWWTWAVKLVGKKRLFLVLVDLSCWSRIFRMVSA